jgi:hypothetical protein
LRGDSLQPLLRVEFLGVGADFGGAVGDRPVHPFAQSQAVSAGRFLRRLARVEINALDAPGNRLVHFCFPVDPPDKSSVRPAARTVPRLMRDGKRRPSR